MDLVSEFREHLSTLGLEPGLGVVAVSGGPDSVALLDLLVRTRDVHRLDLVVAHLDHGIHPDSQAVAERVRELARRYGLPFETARLDLGPGTSETRARAERYTWLERVRRRVGAAIVLTAHHADDQVETVLMRVLAGSGPAGLAAMAVARDRLVRPLLPFRREALARYLQDRGLPAWSDPANRDPRHLRSWLRTELLPLVRARLPGVDARLERVAAQAARERLAWDAVLDALPGLEPRGEPEGVSVAAPPLGAYDSPLVEALLLALARRAGCPLGPSRLGRVVDLLRHRGSGSSVPLGGRWRAELGFDRLYLLATPADPPPSPWRLDGEEGEGVWGGWRFRWRPEPAPARQERAGLTAWFAVTPLTVRAWTPGERVRPLAGRGRRLLVRCFQEARVPRSRRQVWPVLVREDEVVWVPGVCRSDALVPSGGTEAVRVDAEYA